jgi:hypothetical protein
MAERARKVNTSYWQATCWNIAEVHVWRGYPIFT